ncbi:MAG: hypothetical protein AABY83_11085 [Pseudomonadota bacterium]
MTRFAPGTKERIRSLIEVCRLEEQYLQRTDSRLFAIALTPSTIESLPQNDILAERVDAFVARFGRLQDTLGDKLLPTFLILMEETPGAMIENLDRAERLGLIESADDWATIRKLRNRMIHEYVKNPSELADALNAAHEYIPALRASLEAIVQRISARLSITD